MASTNAPAGGEDDKARKGVSNGDSTASGAMPTSGKNIAETPPPTRRLSFSGMFRSASRESNQQTSPIANKVFPRNKRSKSRAFSLSCAPPQPAPLQAPRRPGQVGAFRLETYASEPRRLRSFSSPPDTARASSSSSASPLAGPTALAPPLPVGGRDSVASVRAADFGSTPE